MKIVIFKTDSEDDALYREIIHLATKKNEKIEIISDITTPDLSFPGLTISCEQKQVFRDKNEVKLTRLEYDVLYLLASHAGKVVSEEMIFETVWGKHSENTIKVVPNTISNLRGKIEPNRQAPIYIETVFGGYKFIFGIRI